MQQIERYGVIALVFLLVTIVAVSFWGDSKSPGFWSRLTGRGVKKEATPAQMTEVASTPPSTPPSTAERAIQGDLAMSPAASPAATTTLTPIESAPQAAAKSQPVGNPVVSAALPPNPIVTPAPTPAPEAARPARSIAAPKQPAASSEYVVQKGDNMMQIASKMLGNKHRWTEIREMNPSVDPKSLKVGTKLAMPVSASALKTGSSAKAPVHQQAVAPAMKEHSAPKHASSGTYLVRKGDTMKSIAEKELGDSAKWKEIASANPHVDANHLPVGTNLHMPGGRSEPLVAAAMTSDLSSRPHVR